MADETKWERFERYGDQHVYDGPMVLLQYGLEVTTCSVCGNDPSNYEMPCIDKTGNRRWNDESATEIAE